MIDDLFKEGYKIQRYTTSISNGISTKTYTDLFTGVKGRMRPLNANEVNAAFSQGYTANFRFYCKPLESELRPSDRIVDMIGLKTYEIKAIRDPMSMGEIWQIDCEIKY